MDNKNLQPDVSEKTNETRKPVKIPLPSIITKNVTKQALGGRILVSSKRERLLATCISTCKVGWEESQKNRLLGRVGRVTVFCV